MTQKQEGKKLKIILGSAVSLSKPGIHETLKKKEGEAKGRGEGRGEVRGREDMGREVVWRGGQEEWQCMPQNHSSDFECRLRGGFCAPAILALNVMCCMPNRFL